MKRFEGSEERLKKNAWFKDCDWEGLISREWIPPYIPYVREGDIGIAITGLSLEQILANLDLENFSKLNSAASDGNHEEWDSEF